MIKQKVLIAGFFYGLIFESLGAEAPGFYLLPAMVAAFLYFKFLFMLKAVNAVLAFVSGLFLMIFWAFATNGWETPSLKFTSHIFMYVFLLLILLYIFSYAEKK
ncbi:MAG: hypothetical protein UW93_C0004G0028 [Parcubacteria group bacterium GW2011_GWC1_45_13]|uniref:Uncharacterized protein n=2 Tax=Candidatus Giovannoniibacteriota TaxID=1752738 RepID=A0A0G1L5P0_9BACT|nr:MAG: hypothetical protein UW49_C0004G0028 [Candidatus Giovannonibacteria bacterium GW2011_GWB1_44_23]KKT63917.1 MAG: hypothetical protein UW57_C0004G0027 [Candidatus Giovannonibacteria bacterium GW2011_GWA1_44_29]KKT91630.1 MAG: hypothetical protein UW93_C0004G0028 [Parcubacteria group bacterium GW2011_GWC1_45_13]